MDRFNHNLVCGEMEEVWVDVFETERLLVRMSTALRKKGILLMRGSDARNFAMINRTVMLLQSKKTRILVIMIFIVLFTRGMNADQKTINMRELIIM